MATVGGTTVATVGGSPMLKGVRDAGIVKLGVAVYVHGKLKVGGHF